MEEKQNIEFKEKWNDNYLKWICGFANANGGKIYIGKDDKGKIVGIDNSKRLMEDLPNKIQAHLGIICDVNLHNQKNKSFIEIDIKPYNVPISYQGKYHYRSGSTKQELKGNTLNEFLLKKAGKTWDDVIETRAKFEDIDLSAIEAWGRGTIKIINECTKSGLPEPIIESSSGGISVTLSKNINCQKFSEYSSLNNRQVKAFDYVNERGKITNREYQKINEVNSKTSLRDLVKMCELGVLNLKGKGAGTFYELIPNRYLIYQKLRNVFRLFGTLPNV